MKSIRYIVVMLCLFAAVFALSPTAQAARRNAQPHPRGEVQVFSIPQGKVVLTFPNSPELQAEAGRWIAAVQGLAPQVSAEPRKGLVVRIPLDPPMQVKLPLIDGQIQDAFLFIDNPEVKNPLLLVFTMDNKPVLLQLSYDPASFIQQYGLQRVF